MFENKKRTVNMRADRVFFCVNSVHNRFVIPELINTYPEKWGTPYVILCKI